MSYKLNFCILRSFDLALLSLFEVHVIKKPQKSQIGIKTCTTPLHCIFKVLKLRIELVAHLAQNAKFTKVSADSVMSDLVEKIGDVKNGKAVQECLSCIAEALTLEFVCKEVSKIN